MTFRWLTITAVLVGFCSPLAAVEDLPTMKAGLWETRFVSGGLVDDAPPSKQCVGDKVELDSTLHPAGGSCDVKEKSVSSNHYHSESNCKMGPISGQVKITANGDFSSKVKVEATTTILEGAPVGIPQAAFSKGPRTVVMEMTWTGPCAPGQKPGDFIMPDGKVMRMPALTR
jgi:hypothetical protein